MMGHISQTLQDAADTAVSRLKELSAGLHRPLLACIDGRCTSGKTTLAALLAEQMTANVVHADDFYLQPGQRTPARYAEPGGNLDRERLLAEVIVPWQRSGSFWLRPYDAHRNIFGPAEYFPVRDVTIVEGSYSSHPELWPAYDLRIFLTTDRETQLERVRIRNGEDAVAAFAGQWIPLEELYFTHSGAEARSDLHFRT